MDLQLQGRTVIVTGASAGIGLALTRSLLREGAQVSACARNADRLSTALATEQLHHGDALLLSSADVVAPGDIEQLVDSTVARFGGIDALACNAGAARDATATTASSQDWMAELDLKFRSSLGPIRAALPALEQSSQARCVIVSSLVAFEPIPALALSSSARASVLAASEPMAQTLYNSGILLNTLLLGPIVSDQWRRRYDRNPKGLSWEAWLDDAASTRRIPAGRFGKPEEVARIATFLLSGLCPCHGAVIEIAGANGRAIRSGQVA